MWRIKARIRGWLYWLYCPFLDDGRIYPCAPACFAPYFNKAAGTKIFVEPGLDISTASAREILLCLLGPTFACRYCASGARLMKWKGSRCPSDWVLEAPDD